MAKLITLIFLFILVINSSQADSKMISVDRPNFNSRWIDLNRSEEQAIRMLVEILKESKTGEKILLKAQEKAREQDETIWDILKVGEGSLTDTTLVRRFSPSQPDQMVYESKSKVFINRRLSVKDALLDLAHELTHFSYRRPFNPYRDNFSADQFVKSTVEGRGGEVDAFLVECKVLEELFPTDGKRNSHCDRVREENSKKLSKDRGIHEFYRLGEHYSDFQKMAANFGLGQKELTHISSEEAIFISSAYGMPYPLAALHEYQMIMVKACQNDAKRLALMKAQSEGRSPASQTLVSLEKSYGQRCQFFDSTSVRASGISH